MVGRGGRARGGDGVGQLLGPAARADVHDPGVAGRGPLGRPLDQRPVLRVGVGEALDRDHDLGPLEPLDDDGGIAHVQALDDVGADRGRGRGREGDDDRVVEDVDDVAEAAIVGPEVVAPLADAVGLVDHEQRRLGGHQGVERVVAGELLGGEEHELEVTLPEARERVGARRVAHGGVDLHRLADVLALESHDLVALEGDERRDDDRGAGSGGGHDLVDGRLAVPGGQDGEHVAPPHRGLGCGPLPRPEPVERQLAAGDPVQAASRWAEGPAHRARRSPRAIPSSDSTMCHSLPPFPSCAREHYPPGAPRRPRSPAVVAGTLATHRPGWRNWQTRRA